MSDYIRIACAVPKVCVGNVEQNAKDVCAFLKNADEQNADVLLGKRSHSTVFAEGADGQSRCQSVGLQLGEDCGGIIRAKLFLTQDKADDHAGKHHQHGR